MAQSGQATGGAEVTGVIGNLTGAAVLDTDYYTFSGKEGDVVTVDIDGGMGGARNVDTILGLFGPGPAFVEKTRPHGISSTFPTFLRSCR